MSNLANCDTPRNNLAKVRNAGLVYVDPRVNFSKK